jgi:hypothetical protein
VVEEGRSVRIGNEHRTEAKANHVKIYVNLKNICS